MPYRLPEYILDGGETGNMPLEDTLVGLALGLLIAFAVYLVLNMKLRYRISKVEAEFRRTWAEQEAGIRKDATERSRYVIKGKIGEHIVPLLQEKFRHVLSDARFIGSPIDYVIFDGYTAIKDGKSEGSIEVVIADIKTGEAQLNRTERKIKEAVQAGRVRWETIEMDS